LTREKSERASSPIHVFVVGTGRSGTKTLAEFLSSVPGCTVRHEHKPPLLAEVDAYVKRRLTKKKMVDLLRRTRAPEIIGGERLSGESNQRLSFVLPAVAETFPDARIIWLIRDGRDVVSSMQQRRVYHPQEAQFRPGASREWSLTRIQADEVGDLQPAEWAALDPFARSCWYWAYTNRLIGRDLTQLPLPSLLVKLEDIASSWPPIAEFLELPRVRPEAIPHSNRSRREPMRWQAWSRRQREIFRQLCGPLMDEHYPQWADEMILGFTEEIHALAARTITTARRSAADLTRPLRDRLGLITQGNADGRAED
jgi:hypothetical protein